VVRSHNEQAIYLGGIVSLMVCHVAVILPDGTAQSLAYDETGNLLGGSVPASVCVNSED